VSSWKSCVSHKFKYNYLQLTLVLRQNGMKSVFVEEFCKSQIQLQSLAAYFGFKTKWNEECLCGRVV